MTFDVKERVYDPHILYHAINLTVELRHKVSLQKIYDILEQIDRINKNEKLNITSSDLLRLIQLMGDKLEDTIQDTETSECPATPQEKIKEMLRLLGCQLSKDELNQILSGNIDEKTVMSKDAATLWKIIFRKNQKGRQVPDLDLTDQLLDSMQFYVMQDLEEKIELYLQAREPGLDQLTEEKANKKLLTMKIKVQGKNMELDPVELEKKQNKLRLYIAHMQGYDRDRDRDGGIGIDMTTGLVIDYSDIYIADKEHGSVIEDLEHDGLDVEDIR